MGFYALRPFTLPLQSLGNRGTMDMYSETLRSPSTSIHPCFIHSIRCSCVHHGTGSNTRGTRMAKTGLGLLKGWGEARKMGMGGCTLTPRILSAHLSCTSLGTNLSTSLNSHLNPLWTPDFLPQGVQCPVSAHMPHVVLGWGSRSLAPSCEQICSQTTLCLGQNSGLLCPL